jgi:hypothetical protein
MASLTTQNENTEEEAAPSAVCESTAGCTFYGPLYEGMGHLCSQHAIEAGLLDGTLMPFPGRCPCQDLNPPGNCQHDGWNPSTIITYGTCNKRMELPPPFTRITRIKIQPPIADMRFQNTMDIRAEIPVVVTTCSPL